MVSSQEKDPDHIKEQGSGIKDMKRKSGKEEAPVKDTEKVPAEGKGPESDEQEPVDRPDKESLLDPRD